MTNSVSHRTMGQGTVRLRVAAALAGVALAMPAAAQTVDTFSFTDSGFVGAISPGSTGTLSGTFTGAVEADGRIHLNDLSNFRLTYTIGSTTLFGYGPALFFSYQPGSDSTLDFEAPIGVQGVACVGAVAAFGYDHCGAGGVNGEVAGLDITQALPVLTLVSSFYVPPPVVAGPAPAPTQTPPNPTNVPEPGSFMLLGAGLIGVGVMRRRGAVRGRLTATGPLGLAGVALLAGLWAGPAAAGTVTEFIPSQALQFALPPTSADYPSGASVAGALSIDTANGTVAGSSLYLVGHADAAHTFSTELGLSGDGVGAGVFLRLVTPDRTSELDLYITAAGGGALPDLKNFTTGVIRSSGFNPLFTSLSLGAFDTPENLIGSVGLAAYVPVVIAPIQFTPSVPEPATWGLFAVAAAMTVGLTRVAARREGLLAASRRRV